jgi:drug/metabolite transporter (DMT)-like permease
MAAVAITTLAWAFPPLIIKETTMEPLAFAAYRLWVGVALYVIIFAVTGRRLRWSTVKACAPGGLLFACDVALAFTAFHYTTVADATIIGSLSTITITIGAALWFGERLHRSDLAFVGMSVIGVTIVAIGSSGAPAFSLLGDLAALASVFSWTAYWLYSKRARGEEGALEYMATVMFVAAIAMTIIAPVSGASMAWPNADEWLALFTVALVAGAIGHSLLAWSHQHVEAWLASLILNCQPLVSVSFAWILLGEEVTPLTALGGAVVLGATAIIVVREGRRRPQEYEDAEPTAPSV